MVVSSDLQPLSTIKVTKQDQIIYTDALGHFNFAGKYYYAFLPKEMFYLHPASTNIYLYFENMDYQSCHYNKRDRDGAGRDANIVQNLGSILLMPKNGQKIDADSKKYIKCEVLPTTY